jgi:mono/diheme cytochrome c family protein
MDRDLLRPARWLAPTDLPGLPTALLGLAAIAVGIGGYEHAHLFHQGYREITTIGPLFLLNAIASLVVILMLLARRPGLFVVSALGLNLGAILAIVLTRTSGGLFGFHEAGYDSRATLTLVSEIVAVLLTLAGVAAARGRIIAPAAPDAAAPDAVADADARPATAAKRDQRPPAARRPAKADPRVLVPLAVVAFLVLGGAIVGIGQGSGTAPGVSGTTAPGQQAAAEQRLRALGAVATEGRAVFTGQGGCGGCHRLADAGTSGSIGPDLDTALTRADLAAIRQDIVAPNAKITRGFPANLMPGDFGTRLTPAQLNALTRYLFAATHAP